MRSSLSLELLIVRFRNSKLSFGSLALFAVVVVIALTFTHCPSVYFCVHIALTSFVWSLFSSGIIVVYLQHICTATFKGRTFDAWHFALRSRHAHDMQM